MDKATARSVVHSDLEMMGGTPVFIGTRMPVRILFEYLAAGETLEYFLECFPGITREQVAAAIEEAGNLLVDRANTATNACRSLFGNI
jgi:uncharacterized protein (DUF433 family)